MPVEQGTIEKQSGSIFHHTWILGFYSFVVEDLFAMLKHEFCRFTETIDLCWIRLRHNGVHKKKHSNFDAQIKIKI